MPSSTTSVAFLTAPWVTVNRCAFTKLKEGPAGTAPVEKGENGPTGVVERPGPVRSFVLDDTVDEDSLDAVAGHVERVAVEEHEVRVHADGNASDAIVEHHRFRPVQRERLERVLFAQAVNAREKLHIRENHRAARVLDRFWHACHDTGFRELLHNVMRALVAVILHDHHGADHGDDALLRK